MGRDHEPGGASQAQPHHVPWPSGASGGWSNPMLLLPDVYRAGYVRERLLLPHCRTHAPVSVQLPRGR